MPEYVGSVLLLLCLLQVKHLFADFFLQTPKMLSGRGEYFHIGRAQHAGVHVVGSIISLVIVGAAIPFIVLLCLLEWVIHFHIDFYKARYCDEHELTPQQAVFWRAVGTDQALHQLTYIAMTAAWVSYL